VSRRAAALVATALGLAGCARAPSLEPTAALSAAFDAARGQRRILALVSPS
jgi:hypothetical protein